MEQNEDEENFIKKLDRKFWEQDNKERAKQGRELKPLPEDLMTEEELDISLEKLDEEKRERNKYGYNKNVKFVDSESEEDEEDIIYDSKDRRVYDEDGVSIDYEDEE